MKITLIENLEIEYDVVIVGAGPGGCLAAKGLNKKLKVLLVDKQKYPRHKLCSGILVSSSVKTIKKYNMPNSILKEPASPNFFVEDWNNNINVEISKKFLNADRDGFDKWLIDMIPNNVAFAPLVKLESIKEENDRLCIRLVHGDKTLNILTKKLIGADGADSFIRSTIHKKTRHYVVIQEYYAKDKLNTNFKGIYFIFDTSLNDFYFWVVPKGELVEIGGASEFKANEILEKFKTKLFEKYRPDFKNSFVRKEAALGVKLTDLKNDIFLGNDKILLIGEAAGLISPSSGEGISFSMRSGEFASRAINNNFSKPLKTYKKLCDPLTQEIKSKFAKYNMLKSKEKRIAFLNKASNVIKFY